MMKIFFFFRRCSNIQKIVEDSVKCSSHTFSGLLRLMADTVVLESLVPFFSFFLFLSFFLSFFLFSSVIYFYCYICSYHYGPKH